MVASVPDAERGERIVVLHVEEDLDAAALVGKLSEAGLPNLWIPRREAFHRIGEIPLLGTGKIDLKAVKEMARKLASESPA